MRFIANEYKTNLVDFIINDTMINDYYIFASTIDSEVFLENSTADKKEFLNKTIFGKKVDPNLVFPMIKNIVWEPATVYDQYDDTVDLTDKNFYVVVYPENSNTGDYLIFKCLFNNYGSTSEVAPFYDSEITDQIYNTSDGYTWKFMYSLTVEQFEEYNSIGYLPVITANTAISSSKPISHIEVDNPDTNFGYKRYEGTIIAVDNQEVIIRAGAGTTLNEFTNFFRDQTLYITNTNNVSKIYDILSYSYNVVDSTGRMSLKDIDTFIEPGSTYKILPKIRINGDGYDAKAFPVIEDGRIRRIIMLEKGYGYNSATAEVVNPIYDFNPDNVNTLDVKALIRPILSPGEDHGANIPKELLSDTVMLYANITEADNAGGIIPITSTYCRLGLVKNPEFKISPSPDVFDNRIYVDFSETVMFEVNSRAYQTDELTSEITFESIVHESSSNTVFLAEYDNAFKNRSIEDISFDPSLPLRNEQNQIYSINNYETSNYVQRTGEVIYIASFTDPINRTNESREQYKIVLQF